MRPLYSYSGKLMNLPFRCDAVSVNSCRRPNNARTRNFAINNYKGASLAGLPDGNNEQSTTGGNLGLLDVRAQSRKIVLSVAI